MWLYYSNDGESPLSCTGFAVVAQPRYCYSSLHRPRKEGGGGDRRKETSDAAAKSWGFAKALLAVVEFIRKSCVLSFYNLVGIASVCFPKLFNAVNPSPEVAREDAAAAAAAKGKEKAPPSSSSRQAKRRESSRRTAPKKKGGERRKELMLLTFLWVVCRHSGGGAVIDKSVCDRLWCWSCAKKRRSVFSSSLSPPSEGTTARAICRSLYAEEKEEGEKHGLGNKNNSKTFPAIVIDYLRSVRHQW